MVKEGHLLLVAVLSCLSPNFQLADEELSQYKKDNNNKIKNSLIFLIPQTLRHESNMEMLLCLVKEGHFLCTCCCVDMSESVHPPISNWQMSNFLNTRTTKKKKLFNNFNSPNIKTRI